MEEGGGAFGYCDMAFARDVVGGDETVSVPALLLFTFLFLLLCAARVETPVFSPSAFERSSGSRSLDEER